MRGVEDGLRIGGFHECSCYHAWIEVAVEMLATWCVYGA
jgi:hypothetical protein